MMKTYLSCLFLISLTVSTLSVNTALGEAEYSQHPFVISVKDHGAKGDGVTDDTAAIKAAVEKAKVGAPVVFFPPGEYLISQGIYLHSNLTITGAKGAVLKKVPAVTQRFLSAIPEGGTTVVVENATAFLVGQDCYIWDGKESAFTGTIGQITAIDAATNTITFEGRKSSGAKKAYEATGKSVFSTSFSMLTSSAAGEPVGNLTIEGLTFDCQKQEGEPDGYPLAPIHLDPHPKREQQQNVLIRYNTILNSASDGISVQGCNNTSIENNRVLNCGGHGIHVGFTIFRVTVRNNHIENCGASGIFWCYGVTHMIASNNFIKNCLMGCGGIDAHDVQSVISMNVFEGNGTGVSLSANIKGRTIIANNLFQNNKGTDVDVYVSSFCTISHNMFTGGKQLGVSLRGVERAIVTDNQFMDYEGDHVIRLWRQPGGPQRQSQLIRIAGNIITGGVRASIFAEDSNRITISDNQISPVEEGKAIGIAATCSNVFLRDNFTEGEVTNQASTQP